MTPQIYLDMDGVLADFVAGMCFVHDKPNPYEKGFNAYSFYEAWGMSEEEFWKPANTAYFWRTLFPLDDLEATVAACINAVGEENIIIVSSAPHEAAVAGKKEWLETYMPVALPVCFCSHKHLLAAPNKILLDDTPKQITAFSQASGMSVYFPQPWNIMRTKIIGRNAHIREQLLLAADIIREREQPAADDLRESERPS